MFVLSNRSIAFLGALGLERLTLRREKRKRRCRLQRRTGKPCKRESNYISKSSSAPITGGDNSNDKELSSYYNYYRKGAELLQLLNLKKSKKFNRKRRKNQEKDVEPG